MKPEQIPEIRRRRSMSRGAYVVLGDSCITTNEPLSVHRSPDAADRALARLARTMPLGWSLRIERLS